MAAWRHHGACGRFGRQRWLRGPVLRRRVPDECPRLRDKTRPEDVTGLGRAGTEQALLKAFGDPERNINFIEDINLYPLVLFRPPGAFPSWALKASRQSLCSLASWCRRAVEAGDLPTTDRDTLPVRDSLEKAIAHQPGSTTAQRVGGSPDPGSKSPATE